MMVCKKCRVVLQCKQNEIVVRMGRAEIKYGDLYECPICKAEIITGFGQNIFPHHPDYPSLVPQIEVEGDYDVHWRQQRQEQQTSKPIKNPVETYECPKCGHIKWSCNLVCTGDANVFTAGRYRCLHCDYRVWFVSNAICCLSCKRRGGCDELPKVIVELEEGGIA